MVFWVDTLDRFYASNSVAVSMMPWVSPEGCETFDTNPVKIGTCFMVDVVGVNVAVFSRRPLFRKLLAIIKGSNFGPVAVSFRLDFCHK